MTQNTLAISRPLSFALPKFVFNLKIFWASLFVLMIFLALNCVFQVNAYIRDIYLIGDHQEKISQLNQQQKVLEINFSKINSLSNIDNYVQNFEKAEKIEYIKILEVTALAK